VDSFALCEGVDFAIDFACDASWLLPMRKVLMAAASGGQGLKPGRCIVTREPARDGI
jgi:hypothetical protein